jgi:SM-20-related protein
MRESSVTFPPPPLAVMDDFLDAAMHRALVDWVTANEHRFEHASVIRGAENEFDSAIRVNLKLGDFGPQKPKPRTAFLEALPTVAAALGTKAPSDALLELELTAYGDGAFYKRHYDTAMGHTGKTEREANARQRMLSAVYYFHRRPKAFTGGALRLHSFMPEDTQIRDIEPRDNRLAAFLSWSPHEVLPVACPSGLFRDYRFAITCWYCWPDDN